MDVLYLDFSKAFDRVPIRRLLANCAGLGIRGKLLAWIEEWLTGRSRRVVLNGKESEWGNIKWHDHFGGERERGDLIQAYKVMTGKDVVDHNKWFSMCRDREGGRDTRSTTGMHNAAKLDGKLKIRRNF